MKHQVLDSDGTSSTLTYSEEDGKSHVGTHINLDPHIAEVRRLRDAFATATKSSNPNAWEHIGRIPIPIVSGWCRDNGYTFDQWARNEDGIKDRFLKYFMSREFSKLHNEHITTKTARSSSAVPANYKAGLIVPR